MSTTTAEKELTEMQEVIMAVLRLKIALTTEELANEVGRHMKLPKLYTGRKSFRDRVYRAAIRLEENDRLATGVKPSGHYTKVWRINKY